jgi:hypothetical protein
MKGIGSRVATVKALVVGTSGFAAVQREVVIELDELYDARLVRKRDRRRLLQVLHASRAVDTALAAILAADGVSPAPRSIGQSLNKLGSRGVHGRTLTATDVRTYSARFRVVRNMYAHDAGAFPSESEAATHIADMETCLAKSAALW